MLNMLILSAVSRFFFCSVGFKILVIMSPLRLVALSLGKISLIWIECAAKFHLAYEFIFLILYIDFYG